MNILGMDIGGKTRNGICLMDSDSKEILKYSTIVYDNKSTPLEHRKKILNEVLLYIDEYGVDCLVFERINLFRGQGISPLANIISLCKLQTTLIDNLSDKLSIYDIMVKSWKSRILKSGNATKEDSVNLVRSRYPDVETKIVIPHARKDDEIVDNHDLCDSICIALCCCRYPELLKNKLNYK